MAEEAQSASRGKKVEFESFLKKVIDAGEDILQKTPEMLPVLKKAGVVDAGGRGLVTVFDGMYRTLVGEELTLISGGKSLPSKANPSQRGKRNSILLKTTTSISLSNIARNFL